MLIADEAELQGECIAIAQDRGWMVKPSSQGSKQGGRPQRAMRNGTSNGFPDLTIARNGVVLFAELKMDRGEPTAAQLRWSAHLPNWFIIRPADLGDGRFLRILEENEV